MTQRKERLREIPIGRKERCRQTYKQTDIQTHKIKYEVALMF